MIIDKIILSDGYDPTDEHLKLLIHSKADSLNIIGHPHGYPQLLCGAMKRGQACKKEAGFGTDHKGYGRCKWHGGCSTGPKTYDGKQTAAKNSVTHGIYSHSLSAEEDEIFNTLIEDKIVGLELEIYMLKTKIISYLIRQNEKFNNLVDQYGEEEAYRRTKVYYNESDSGARNFYHAGTIEDRPLDRALNTLSRLVEKQARIAGDDKDDDIITQINAELKAASHGNISLSWGGKPQTRGDK